jgi:F0F1-type ATP synthase assembly protein I
MSDNIFNSKHKSADKDGPGQSFFSYATGILLDLVLGVLLGIFVNTVVDFFAKTFNMPFYVAIILQILFIICILYLMKVDSKYLYTTWRGGRDNYGILFTAAFLGVQSNIVKFLEDIWSDEDASFNIDTLTTDYRSIRPYPRYQNLLKRFTRQSW